MSKKRSRVNRCRKKGEKRVDAKGLQEKENAYAREEQREKRILHKERAVGRGIEGTVENRKRGDE